MMGAAEQRLFQLVLTRHETEMLVMAGKLASLLVDMLIDDPNCLARLSDAQEANALAASFIKQMRNELSGKMTRDFGLSDTTLYKKLYDLTQVLDNEEELNGRVNGE